MSGEMLGLPSVSLKKLNQIVNNDSHLLKTTHANTEEDQSDGKAAQSPVLVLDHIRNGRDNDDDVAKHGHRNGSMNGLEAAPSGIGNPATE